MKKISRFAAVKRRPQGLNNFSLFTFHFSLESNAFVFPLPGGGTDSPVTLSEYNMTLATSFWKVWLRENLLTKDVDNDYIAEVSTEKNTLRNEDIARKIVEEGSEIKYDTLLSVINQHDRIIRTAIQQGFSVLTQTCQFTPRVSGTWIGTKAQFDPNVHKITLDIIPSAEMRKALTEVGVEVLGAKDAGASIGLVTDTATGKTDGTITKGDDIMIEGSKIKVTPEEEAGIGVFFISAGGEETKVTRRLTQNDPSKVIARVPADLEAGTYTLRIVTRFSNSVVLLKEQRVVEYERTLTVN